MYQCPHLTSLRAKTGTEQELSWILPMCVRVPAGASHILKRVCVCVYNLGFMVVCVCLKLCLLFRDAAVLWSKGKAQREKLEKKGVMLLFSKKRHCFNQTHCGCWQTWSWRRSKSQFLSTNREKQTLLSWKMNICSSVKAKEKKDKNLIGT